MLTVACVRTGQKYSPEYVTRLRAGVQRHLPLAHRFVCITDYPRELPKDTETLPADPNLPGWWAKMQLFEPTWRAGQRVLYLDLDSIIIGDISPLSTLKCSFGICANFTVEYQERVSVVGGTRPGKTWPCKYGSMCMLIGSTLNGHIWTRFMADAAGFIKRADHLGDQKTIEEIEPGADLFQNLLPEGFFLGYRDLPRFSNGPPAGAKIIVFAGKHKPHNTSCAWARREWLSQ